MIASIESADFIPSVHNSIQWLLLTLWTGTTTVAISSISVAFVASPVRHLQPTVDARSYDFLADYQ